jgi:DNA-binding transcriptional MerR regulator
MSRTQTPVITLTALSDASGVSAPTIIRYQKAGLLEKYTKGEGRSRRYKETAIPVVQKLKAKGLKNRGRRPAASAPAVN